MFGVYEKEEEGVYEEGVGAGQWPEGALTRGAATHDAMHRYSKLHHVDSLHTTHPVHNAWVGDKFHSPACSTQEEGQVCCVCFTT